MAAATSAACRVYSAYCVMSTGVCAADEAGREAVGKGGIVRDAADRRAAITRVRAFIEGTAGWTVIGEMASPILGGSGNEEILIGARYGA